MTRFTNPRAAFLEGEFALMQEKTHRVFDAFKEGKAPSVADSLWLAQCIGTAMGVLSERAAALERQGMTSCPHHPETDCACYCRFMGCSPNNCPETPP